MRKKKLFALVMTLIFAFSMSIVVSASEAPEETAVVRTWKNAAGEQVTGIITRGSEVLAARVNPREANQARGFITGKEVEKTVTPYFYDEYQVSDFFYMQIYNSGNQVISKYKVTVTGMVSRVDSERYITSVSFSRISGDTCTTNYSMNGYNATVTLTHPTEGFLNAYITLGTGGSFTIY